MTEKIDYKKFCDGLQVQGNFVMLEDVMHQWNGVHWESISELDGEALTLAWIKENVYPNVTDCSEGFWRRWDVVPFRVVIPESERDAGLADAIIAGELSGVLIWALEGLSRLMMRGGFEAEMPESMKAALLTAKKVADDITGWFHENVGSSGGEPCTAKNVIFKDYCAWCVENDFSPKSQNAFWLNLKRSRTSVAEKKVRVGKGFDRLVSLELRPRIEEISRIEPGTPVNEQEFRLSA